MCVSGGKRKKKRKRERETIDIYIYIYIYIYMAGEKIKITSELSLCEVSALTLMYLAIMSRPFFNVLFNVKGRLFVLFNLSLKHILRVFKLMTSLSV